MKYEIAKGRNDDEYRIIASKWFDRDQYIKHRYISGHLGPKYDESMRWQFQVNNKYYAKPKDVRYVPDTFVQAGKIKHTDPTDNWDDWWRHCDVEHEGKDYFQDLIHWTPTAWSNSLSGIKAKVLEYIKTYNDTNIVITDHHSPFGYDPSAPYELPFQWDMRLVLAGHHHLFDYRDQHDLDQAIKRQEQEAIELILEHKETIPDKIKEHQTA